MLEDKIQAIVDKNHIVQFGPDNDSKMVVETICVTKRTIISRVELKELNTLENVLDTILEGLG